MCLQKLQRMLICPLSSFGKLAKIFDLLIYCSSRFVILYKHLLIFEVICHVVFTLGGRVKKTHSGVNMRVGIHTGTVL